MADERRRGGSGGALFLFFVCWFLFGSSNTRRKDRNDQKFSPEQLAGKCNFWPPGCWAGRPAGVPANRSALVARPAGWPVGSGRPATVLAGRRPDRWPASTLAGWPAPAGKPANLATGASWPAGPTPPAGRWLPLASRRARCPAGRRWLLPKLSRVMSYNLFITCL